MDATIRLYTFKEGLLSKLAHDLRLTLGRFEVTVRAAAVQGTFAPDSLSVDGAIKDGQLATTILSDGDKAKIRENIAKEVLEVRAHPEARFSGKLESSTPPFTVSGSLTLHGVTQPISLTLRQDASRLKGSIEIIPSTWGIKPYRALGGTLKVRDLVRIEIDADARWLSDGSMLLTDAVELSWKPR